MTVLIAWASLSVGIIMGALWRSLCETQSRSKSSYRVDSSTAPPALSRAKTTQSRLVTQPGPPLCLVSDF